MAVTRIAKPGDFANTFSVKNRSTDHTIMYGVTQADGKIYRQSINHDSLSGPGGPGTWVDTGLTLPDLATPADM